ncbi:GerMN domain-containing protein [Desulfosporosinus fructosivorans]
MKKIFLIVSLLISLLLLSSCADKDSVKPDGDNTSTPPNTNAEVLTIKDYFGQKENSKYVYEGQGNEFASYTVFMDYKAGNRVQQRSNNGGTEMVKVLENKDGELRILLSRGECYYRENLTQAPSSNVEILLKEPLEIGTSWTLADSRIRSITNLQVEVATPSGTYKTLEVTTVGKGDKTLDYYAPNIGLVKSVFTSNGVEVSSTLSKLETNVSFIQTVRFYFPNTNVDKLYFVNKELSFKTNDITKIFFENAFRDLPKGNVAKVLGPNVKIKSLYLNQDNRAYIDFTKEFLSEMNAGSSYENLILQSITNTIGTYYGVDKVSITIEGNPYVSGHIGMKKDEFFTVNLTNSVELK